MGGEDISSLGITTQLTLLGRDTDEQYGFVNPPLYKGSTVIQKTVHELENNGGRYIYGTIGTPTIENLEKAWTQLTGASGTVLSPSGLGSIALVLMSLVRAGDHILISDSVYQPTRELCDGLLAKFNVVTEYYDPSIGSNIEKLIKSSTSVIFLESPGSQTMELQDIPAITKVARKRGVKTVLDNTWATPLFFKAHAHGIDVSIESGTKYLGGHSDLLIGLASATAECFPLLRATYDAISMVPSAEDCLGALKGLRTLHLRLKEAEKKALALAKWLQERPEVLKVLHPALKDCPGHDHWVKNYEGSSGVFSVVLQDGYTKESFVHMLEGTKIFRLGFSWGGYESLITPVNPVEYRSATTWGHKGFTMRLQVGLEDLSDLKRDLTLGFEYLTGHSKPRL
ncbi:LADA_0D13102g1_1 [Lachancea dasiensis]|uniref:LADA_0D13102g1_1 n=1 Tax=Lachancea dasiensis TaxID=1072105 RepID=A0A1G4J8G2_9SACH|nr:LADA_0D13102g1_1 [Lachancea dasiensis]